MSVLMRLYDISCRQLGRLTGHSESFIGNIRSGNVNLGDKSKALRDIGEALGASPDTLQQSVEFTRDNGTVTLHSRHDETFYEEKP
ncbi:MAG: hypothetical protein GIX02_00570 [Candidatus Eremiobacteraeota bacterium]|nr:hypothetical protein [Candidatus Eremiobacteraeota bacterium]